MQVEVYKDMKIEIIKSDSSDLLSIRNIGSFQIVIILLIVHFSTLSTKSKYIYMDKLYFLFDLSLCNRKTTGMLKFTIPTWKVDKELKNKLIILIKNDILIQSESNKKVRYSLSDYGNCIVNKLIEINEFDDLINMIKANSKISNSDFEKSKVVL
ncbi:hypothetical protein [Photobacterium leiognathi]|uniref:hypothetical protein n=1 Tax=Photobacterium leiognathi TaxID=553611 RepID=UPI00068ADC31|nr:hypothetical protein [Photobacterium leiognathi]